VRTGIDLPAGVWFNEPVREMTIFAEQYDFAVSLLMLSNDPPPFEEGRDEGAYDWTTRRQRR